MKGKAADLLVKMLYCYGSRLTGMRTPVGGVTERREVMGLTRTNATDF